MRLPICGVTPVLWMRPDPSTHGLGAVGARDHSSFLLLERCILLRDAGAADTQGMRRMLKRVLTPPRLVRVMTSGRDGRPRRKLEQELPGVASWDYRVEGPGFPGSCLEETLLARVLSYGTAGAAVATEGASR